VITTWTIDQVRSALAPARRRETIGFVPTMGALHDGHLALIQRARRDNDVVVASIFVNPAQFGGAEDLGRYPSNVSRDARLAERAGVDILFAPGADEMYPPGFQTWVEVEELSRGMEGDARPGHFRGVATVCLKLFMIVGPDRAYFGQKDAQQAAVVGQLARDLSLELEICVVPTVRDEDGVALSSRNAYLSPDEREAARAVHRALLAGESAYRQRTNPASVARAVLAEERRLRPDYVETARLNGRLVLAIAAHAGSTRLIDNVVLEGDTL
jgi:pantoate--beta-alanine ligase